MRETLWFLAGLAVGCAVFYPSFRALLRWKREQR